MNTFKLKLILVLIILINTKFSFSQVTIATETTPTIQEAVVKPPIYDSLENWKQFERLADYKQYIGQQIYLPPFKNSFGRDMVHPFIFTLVPKMVVLKDSSYLYSSAYKPKFLYGSSYYYAQGSDEVQNDEDVSNNYFTIIDVIYGDKLKILFDKVKKVEDSIESFFLHYNCKAIFVGDQRMSSEYLYLIKNNKTDELLYCNNKYELEISGANETNFILVPYFVKQKQLYQNKYLIYDEHAGYVNELPDLKSKIITENNEGKKDTIAKNVKVLRGSKWICTDVSLMNKENGQPNLNGSFSGYYYSVYYIAYTLKNEKGETIALDKSFNSSFILEKDYITREANKKIQSQQLLAKQKQEELVRIQNEKNEIAKRKTECINKFGNENGTLIADGKVAIGMTKEMCKYSWGTPSWTDKTITEQTVYEKWHYGYGYILNFIDDKLTVIKE